jgi:hypothetical protein
VTAAASNHADYARRPVAPGSSLTTLVYRKVLLGRISIAVITPFHRLVVKASLRQLRRCLEAKRR